MLKSQTGVLVGRIFESAGEEKNDFFLNVRTNWREMPGQAGHDGERNKSEINLFIALKSERNDKYYQAEQNNLQ